MKKLLIVASVFTVSVFALSSCGEDETEDIKQFQLEQTAPTTGNGNGDDGDAGSGTGSNPCPDC